MLSINAAVAHHTILEEGCFLAMSAKVGANLVLREKAFIGIGAICITGIDYIGRNAIVGAGAVIIRNVENYDTVVGNPGKSIEKHNYNYLTS